MPSNKLAWGISVGNEAASFVLDERFSTEKEAEEFIAHAGPDSVGPPGEQGNAAAGFGHRAFASLEL